MTCEESALRPRRDRRPRRRRRLPPPSRRLHRCAPLRRIQRLRCAPQQAPRRLPPAVPGRLRCRSRSAQARSASCLASACIRCAHAADLLSPRTARAMKPHALHAGRSAPPLFPPSPLAQLGPAPSHRGRMRSRGSRPAGRHNARLRAGSCLSRRGTRHPWRAKPRARVIRRYVSRPASTSLCAPRCAAPAARCWRVLHALRASARHPWLAASCGRVALRVGWWLRLRPGCRHALALVASRRGGLTPAASKPTMPTLRERTARISL